MFNIRQLNSEDLVKIKEIHEKHYKNEFDLPDFLNKFIFTAIVEHNNRIICAGGVRTICESILLTDKDVDFHDKLQALGMMLDANLYFTSTNGYDEIHAFIQDEVWKKYLMKAGFYPTKGQCFMTYLK